MITHLFVDQEYMMTTQTNKDTLWFFVHSVMDDLEFESEHPVVSFLDPFSMLSEGGKMDTLFNQKRIAYVGMNFNTNSEIITVIPYSPTKLLMPPMGML